MEIRPAITADAEAIRAIYNHEVTTALTVFDMEPRSLEEQEVWLTEDRRTVIMVTHDTEEALLLADEVVVMAADPAEPVRHMDVGFERPRAPELVSDPEFVAQRAALLAMLGL